MRARVWAEDKVNESEIEKTFRNDKGNSTHECIGAMQIEFSTMKTCTIRCEEIKPNYPTYIEPDPVYTTLTSNIRKGTIEFSADELAKLFVAAIKHKVLSIPCVEELREAQRLIGAGLMQVSDPEQWGTGN